MYSAGYGGLDSILVSGDCGCLMIPASCCVQGPRRCEYNARLYCHECHKGDLAELPALVLHHWDFQPRPVSTLGADYLASIADRPLLCIGAVNPGVQPDVMQNTARVQDLHGFPAGVGENRCMVCVLATWTSGVLAKERYHDLVNVTKALCKSVDVTLTLVLTLMMSTRHSISPTWPEKVL